MKFFSLYFFFTKKSLSHRRGEFGVHDPSAGAWNQNPLLWHTLSRLPWQCYKHVRLLRPFPQRDASGLRIPNLAQDDDRLVGLPILLVFHRFLMDSSTAYREGEGHRHLPLTSSVFLHLAFPPPGGKQMEEDAPLCVLLLLRAASKALQTQVQRSPNAEVGEVKGAVLWPDHQ